MTTTNTTTKVVTTGNGVTTAFAFLFPVTATDEIVVEIETIATGVIDPPETEITDYTVALNTASEGGTVNMIVAPTSLQRLIVRRDLTLDMTLDLPAVGNVQEPQLEGEFDKQARLNIQIQEQLSRAALQSIAETGSGFTFPEAVALEIIGFNAAGTDLESVVNPATAAATSATAAAADAVSTAADVVSTNADVVLTNADVVLTNADVVLTNADVASLIPSLTNKSGGEHILGDVCIVSGGTNSAVANTTTQGDQTVICVSTATIADNAAGNYRVKGIINVNIKGTVTRKDFIRTSTTAKQAESAGTAVVDGVFGIALATGTDTLVSCLLMVPASTVSPVQDFAKDAGEGLQKFLRGAITGAGSINAGTGFTISKGATGLYTINITTTYGDLPAITYSNVEPGGDIIFTAKSTSSISVANRNSAGTLTDGNWDFMMSGDIT